MKVLLDTHILLWAVSDPSKLSINHRKIIEKPDNIIFISIATLWELTIKQSLGKIELPENFLEDLKLHGYEIMKVDVNHLIELRQLPLYHRDPFDRIIIAQAITERCQFLTVDREIEKYQAHLVS